MRIRTIKPEFWISESVGRLSRDARLLFIGLWSFADDSGRGRGALPMIAGALFPFDADAREKLPGWFAELEHEGMARRYIASDGNSYFDLPKFLQHQRIDKPSESKIPPFLEHSTNSPRMLQEYSGSPRPCTYVPMELCTGEQGTGNTGAVAPAAGAASPPDDDNEAPPLALAAEPPKPRPPVNPMGDTLEQQLAKQEARKAKAKFTPPTETELGAYAAEIGMAPARAANFMDYQIAKGWKVGTAPMKCWKAALRTWNARPDFNAPSGNAAPAVNPKRNGSLPYLQIPTEEEWAADRAKDPPKTPEQLAYEAERNAEMDRIGKELAAEKAAREAAKKAKEAGQ